MSGSEIRQWYSLIKEILDDILVRFPSENRQRLQSYQGLFKILRLTHLDYVSCFTNFVSDTLGENNLQGAKKNFNDARRLHAGRRYIEKQDALNYVSLAKDPLEKRFLFSLCWYFHYLENEGYGGHDIGSTDFHIHLLETMPHPAGTTWDSASSRFWDEIKESNDKVLCADKARLMLASLSTRFSAVLLDFTALEANWEHSVTPPRSWWSVLKPRESNQ